MSALQNIPGRLRISVLVLIPCIAVWLAYAPARDYGYVGLDDTTYVEVNPWVQQGLTMTSVRWAFTHTHEAYWIPLTWISFMADVSLWGPGPRGHHTTNILLHGLNACLLMAVLLRHRVTRRHAVLMTCIYALHPLAVEPVVWVTGRKDLLCAAFWLGTMLAFDGPPGRRWWIAALGTALAVMSKPLAMTLPLLLGFLALWRGDSVRRAVTVLAPSLAIAFAGALVAFALQSGVGATHAPSIPDLAKNLAIALANAATYLGTILWPVALGPEYPLRTWTPLLLVVGAAVGLALVLGLARCSWGQPVMRLGLAWCAAAFLPVIGLIQVGTVSIADRFTYIPMMGLSLAAATALDLVPRAGRTPVIVVLAVLVLLCFRGTVEQRRLWQSPVTLFSHVLERYPDHALAHNYLGTALVEAGRTAEAMRHFDDAVRLNPRHAEARVNLAVGLMQMGQLEKASAMISEALVIKPDLAEAWFNQGLICAMKGDRDGAVLAMREVLDSELVDADLRLAACIELARHGDEEGAYTAIQAWIADQPNPDLARQRLPAYLEQAGVGAFAARFRD